MNDIRKLKTLDQNQPYHIPLKVKVEAVGETKSYTKDGRNNSITVLGCGDLTDFIKMVCYDDTKLSLLSEGKCVMIRNYILRDNTLVITTKSKVSSTSSIGELSTEVSRKAKEVIIEKDSSTVKIANLPEIGVGKTVTIVGRVIKEEEQIERTLSKSQEKVPVKNIVLKDSTGEVKISLWRDLASTSCTVGSHLTVTNLKTNLYRGIVSLNNTWKTTIKPAEATSTTQTVTIDGHYEEAEKLIFVCLDEDNNYVDIVCPKVVLATIITEEEDMTDLNNMLPLKANIETHTINGEECLKTISVL